MSHLICLGVVLTLVTLIQAVPHPPATTAAPLKQTYDNKFDNIDIDEILGQERLLNNYIKCLEGLGPCTPDAKMLKETLPDAIMTNCAKCTERQKYGSDKVTHHLIDNRPADWNRLEKIYDPEGSYRKAYLMQKENTTTKVDKEEENPAKD
ncbi:putative odorant-binding protein A10 isoform X1 [Lucilia sericata]|uniref:putative odorant-binding protein A10 isoform X1 n=1 Tax=Lucilia sericata TaxID=13632 RepID=UPI0018A87481|nr:putative odorant-binding protein A10 isoform X1 [Lucilia sericata]